MEKNDFRDILLLQHSLSLLFISAMFMQENLTILWAFMREIILLEDISIENCMVYVERYYHEKLIRRKERAFWMRNRYIGWWEEIVSQFTADDWRENFRMTKKTFEYLCTQLQHVLAPKFNPLMPREPITVSKQAAIAIFFYASSCEYRVIANLFGVHKTSVWRSVHNVTKAINTVLTPMWITLPDENECEEISAEFEKITGMPNFIRAIDGSHIPILPSSDGYRDFINRKGWPSYVLQGLVDHKLRFRNINVESPGCNHDANVIRNSAIYNHYEQLICQKKKIINGVRVPYMIMGDPACPLLPWSMKAFVFSEARTEKEESFNVYMNSGRVKVEIAFGRLKSRWRRLSKRIDCHHTFVPQVVAACCTLHNIVESRNNPYNKNWDRQRITNELLFPQPELIEEEADETSNYAKRIRNVLVDIVSTLPKRKSLR